MTSLRADHGEPARVSAHSAIKLRVPALPACNVRRPRLLDQLDAAGPEGVPESVVVVHGPAGSGKTSLVADWAGTVAKPVSWFTLDERDRVAPECWTNLVAAIDRLRPGCLDDAHCAAARRTFASDVLADELIVALDRAHGRSGDARAGRLPRHRRSARADRHVPAPRSASPTRAATRRDLPVPAGAVARSGATRRPAGDGRLRRSAVRLDRGRRAARAPGSRCR